MKDIANTDYGHAKRIYEDFELINLGEYHDSYVQSDILFLADVSENLHKYVA